MRFLYHIVPEEMHGHVLYPLNTLRDVRPDLFLEEVKKYEGRETIMKAVVPQLNCLWNDVLHLSPVHPEMIAEAMREAGRKEIPQIQWFQIPTTHIESENAIVFETRANMYVGDKDYDFRLEHVKPFAEFEECKEVPPWVKEYYKTEIEHGRRPLLFNGIDHILVKTPISVQGLEIVEWLS